MMSCLDKQEEAIEIASENCWKFHDFNKYGVPTLEDRLPSNTTSILVMSSTSRSDKDLIVAKVAD